MIERLRLAVGVVRDVRGWGGRRVLAAACGIHAMLAGTDGEVPGFLLRRIEPLLWPRFEQIGAVLGITPAPGEDLLSFMERLDLRLR